MKFFNIVFIGLAASVSAKSIVSRSAGYGDEVVTPAPVVPEAPAAGYGAPAPVAPVAPAPVETVVTETKQEYNAVAEPPKVEQSGYRKKRGAAYGDEAVTPAPVVPEAPAAGYGAPAPVAPVAPAPIETVVTETKQEYNAVAEPPKVEQSGYRKKRGAAYGDEAVTPAPVVTEAPAAGYGAPAPVAPVAPAPVETVVTETKQEYNAVAEPPKVEQSGYRKKRGAAYGDEAVTPAPVVSEAPAAGYGAPAPVAPVAPAPIETVVTETKQEYNAVAEPPKVEQSGYRKKRGAAYGDEAVTPAPVVTEAPAAGYGAPAPVAPVAPAPVETVVTETKQEYNAVAEPPKVEQSGYRKKRGAAYGDEAVTPAPVVTEAPAAGYGAPAPVAPVAPAPVEQTVVETKQDYSAPAPAPVPSVPEVQPSGY